jgi:hypothetical protein
MKLKKYSLILTAVLLLNFSSTYAAAVEPPRFREMRYENIELGQFDTETIKYTKDPYRNEFLLDVWIKTLPDQDNGSYSLTHYLFRLKDREMMLLEQIEYGSSGEILYQSLNKYNAALWTQIIPETLAEKWYSALLKYAQINDVTLRKEYKNNQKNHNEKNSNNLPVSFSGIASLFN